MLYEIRKIDVWSVTKIAFFVSAIVGFVFSLIMGTLFWLFSKVLGETLLQGMESGGGHFTGIMTIGMALTWMPLFGTFGAISSAAVAFIYNLIVRLTGGIILQLENLKGISIVEKDFSSERVVEEGEVGNV